MKAIVVGGGVTERQAAAENLNRAQSPEQIAGAVNDSIIPLMAGQIKGLRQQYETSTGLHDFDDRLLPETKKFLGAGAAMGAMPLPMVRQGGKMVPDSSKLQDGQLYTLPDGQTARFDEKRMGFTPE